MYKYLVNDIMELRLPGKFGKWKCLCRLRLLAKRSWNGSKVCCFYSTPKTIQHLFFDCHYARFLWCVVFVLFGINPPRNRNHLFNSWSKLGGSNYNYLLLIEAAIFVGWYGSWRMIWFLIKVTPKLFCRFFLWGHTGYDFGLCCSTWMMARNGFLTLVSY